MYICINYTNGQNYERWQVELKRYDIYLLSILIVVNNNTNNISIHLSIRTVDLTNLNDFMENEKEK